MKMKRYLIHTVLMVLLAGTVPLKAQTAAELLQKGIYTQETLGDVDGAIKIYRQILSTAGEVRTYAAQAQYRLGLCLLRKGERAEAEKTFTTLVEQYPDQKDLVAKAKEQLNVGVALLPVPWPDAELMELDMKLAGGLPIGTAIYSIETDSSKTTPQWSISSATHVYNGILSLSQVQADRETMKPIASLWRHPMLGEARAQYGDKSVQVELKGKQARDIPVDGPVYDNEEAMWVMRRLPLAPGFKTSLNVLASLTSTCVKIDLQVTGMEDVEVPAGRFRAYKLELNPIKQTFWIASDANRYMVKFEGNGVVAELASVRRPDSSPAQYVDSKLGYTLTAPSRWIPKKHNSPEEMQKTLFLLDPEAAGDVRLWADKATAVDGAIDLVLRKDAEEKVQQRAKALKGYTVRPDSWRVRQVNGQPALSYVADFEEMNRKMTEYLTWVRSPSTSSLFIVRAPETDFEGFRGRIEPMVESLRLK
ncbi:MAG TPA: DUF3108 domain-containing protein [Bryobacteraceae bacterium]|nr:DUF3108 domain-containing protein [Bryobacteraceae bacterium]